MLSYLTQFIMSLYSVELPEVVSRLKNLNFGKVAGKKLIIWIEDEVAEDSDRGETFGRLLLVSYRKYLIANNLSPVVHSWI
jgi:hypothetical protein